MQEKGIDKTEVKQKTWLNLNLLRQIHVHNFNEWDLGFLCDYIVNTHHKYVLKSLPELVHYTEKIAMFMETDILSLKRWLHSFSEINRELLQHLKNEEEFFFLL